MEERLVEWAFQLFRRLSKKHLNRKCAVGASTLFQ
jgi:hypothetical protein